MDANNKDEAENNPTSEVVRWQRFLPGMVLRVLLVEADDSTRHIISALLRKCNYLVSAVPDGLTAWETLRVRPHSIDLILTEVELPSISGFALLTLVMEHHICKNIPVIMMSSHDSISMVLNCMLKGAADFLIKPVRRNELRNLWQHVWRRQTHQVEVSSENNAESSHSSDFYADSSCKDKEFCEKGLSETKVRNASSFRNVNKEKDGAELDKESVAPPSIETEERPRKLRSVIGSQDETLGIAALECQAGSASLKTIIPAKNIYLRGQTGDRNDHSEVNSCNDDATETCSGVIDLIGTFDHRLKCNYEQSSYVDGINNFEPAPHLELSLRRFCSTNSMEGSNQRRMLNHSTVSAFSRYNSGKASKAHFLTATTNSNEDATISDELVSNEHSENSLGDCQQHKVSSACGRENITAQILKHPGQAEALPNPQLELSVPVTYYNSACAVNSDVAQMYYKQPGLAFIYHSDNGLQVSEQGCHRPDETANNLFSQQKKMDAVEGTGCDPYAAGQSGNNSFYNGIMDHENNTRHGNIGNGGEGNANLATRDDQDITPESLNQNGHIHDRYVAADSGRLSQREAALAKFRLKRKERCFEKKVRYQSRKRLAEQRPRVKGQFVRQVQNGCAVADGLT